VVIQLFPKALVNHDFPEENRARIVTEMILDTSLTLSIDQIQSFRLKRLKVKFQQELLYYIHLLHSELLYCI
jgi:hypothetical protein